MGNEFMTRISVLLLSVVLSGCATPFVAEREARTDPEFVYSLSRDNESAIFSGYSGRELAATWKGLAKSGEILVGVERAGDVFTRRSCEKIARDRRDLWVRAEAEAESKLQEAFAGSNGDERKELEARLRIFLKVWTISRWSTKGLPC